MGARMALDKCRAYPSICPSHISAPSKQSQLNSERNPNPCMYPTQGSLIHSYQLKKKKLQLSWLSLSSKTDWVNPHLPPREEWLQLQFVSLCSHSLQNSQYPPETTEVICTLNLDLGACSTIKCVPRQTSQPESL